MGRFKRVAALLILCPILAGYALAQAATEAVVAHGAAASVGTSAGTMLGHAANQLGEKVGQQTSSAIPHPPAMSSVRASSRAHGKVPAAIVQPVPASTSLVISIEGAEHDGSFCPPVSSRANNDKSARSQALVGTCQAQQAPSLDSHPAVINLGPAR